MKAIEVTGLSKDFGSARVLDSVSFSIPQGEIFGLLGPNGSGKTTMVRVINGILGRSSGSVSICGKSIDREAEEIHRITGVMTETAASYENLTAMENLDFFGKLYGMGKGEIESRSSELLETLGLNDARDRKVREYSTGMKKRMSLARTLLHSPKILFLDEPTSGLDPESARHVSLLIKKMAEDQGVTVFLCTHQLKYAEEICSLYGFLNKGRLIGFGTLAELLVEKNSGRFIEIRGSGIPEKFNQSFQKESGIYRIPISGDGDAAGVLREVVESGGLLYEARQSRWSLEDLYFSYQGGDEDEASSESHDV